MIDLSAPIFRSPRQMLETLNVQPRSVLEAGQTVGRMIWQQVITGLSRAQAPPPPPSGKFTFTSTSPAVPWPGFHNTGESTLLREPTVTLHVSRKHQLLPHRDIEAFREPSLSTDRPAKCRNDSHSGTNGQEPSQYEDKFRSHSNPFTPRSYQFTEAALTQTVNRVRRNADLRHKIISGTTLPRPYSLMDVRNPLHQHAAQPTIPPIMSSSQQTWHECVACTADIQNELLSPCQHCNNWYCRSCIHDMFVAASQDPTRMPPKCCALIQLHIGLPLLDSTERSAFKERFSQWISTYRMYCPNPRCSAPIPDHYIRSLTRSTDEAVQDTMTDGQSRVVQKHDRPQLPNTILCRECLTSVCTSCRRVAHGGQQCDLSEAKETERMLAKLKYKTCPNCNTAVRRMFGCPHMQCHCGAHWCWHCKSPIMDCNGAHEEENEDDEGEDEDEVDEEREQEEIQRAERERAEEEAREARRRQAQQNEDTIMTDAGSVDGAGDHDHAAAGTTQHGTTPPVGPDLPARNIPPTNDEEEVEDLDDGLEENGAYNFGEEPGDGHFPWGCRHQWRRVCTTRGFKHIEDHTVVECNCCYVNISSSWVKNAAFGLDGNEVAYVCLDCNVLYCGSCRDFLQNARPVATES